MKRRKFSREYKLEAVKLVRERGVCVAQAARDLDVHENVLRKWARAMRSPRPLTGLHSQLAAHCHSRQTAILPPPTLVIAMIAGRTGMLALKSGQRVERSS